MSRVDQTKDLLPSFNLVCYLPNNSIRKPWTRPWQRCIGQECVAALFHCNPVDHVILCRCLITPPAKLRNPSSWHVHGHCTFWAAAINNSINTVRHDNKMADVPPPNNSTTAPNNANAICISAANGNIPRPSPPNNTQQHHTDDVNSGRRTRTRSIVKKTSI